jgi:hypothetical protein
VSERVPGANQVGAAKAVGASTSNDAANSSSEDVPALTLDLITLYTPPRDSTDASNSAMLAGLASRDLIYPSCRLSPAENLSGPLLRDRRYALLVLCNHLSCLAKRR